LTLAGAGWVPFAAVAALCVAYLPYQSRRDRRRASALPPGLARLAYFAEESAVAFVWQWRRGNERRLRILRSDSHGAHGADVVEASSRQSCVFDGRDDQFVDREVEARRTYHYSLFAEDGAGRWSAPVYLQVMTVSPEERAAFEAAETAPSFVEAGESETGSRDAQSGIFASDRYATPLGDALGRTGLVSSLATEAIFSAASVFARERAADGWVEIE
jgi:hypothetical protein